MKIDQPQTRRQARVSLVSALALLLMLGISSLLSHFQAQAQSVTEAAATLAVTKQVNKTEAAPGDTLAYTITIENQTTSPVNAWMTDTLHSALTNVSGLDALFGNVGLSSGVITWSYTLAGRQTEEIYFTAEILPSIEYAEIDNTAQVIADGQLIEDSVTTIAIAAVGNLDNAETFKEITTASETVEPGDIVTFTIRVTNDSADPVPNAQFVDRLPQGLVLVGQPSGSIGTVLFENNVVTWSYTLQGRTFDQVSFNARVTNQASDGPVTNTVQIIAPNQTIARTATFAVQRRYGNLQAVKTVYPSSARPGEYLTYTIHLSNTGDGELGTLWMTDELPSEVSLVPNTLTATRGVFGVTGNVIIWTNEAGPGGSLLLPQEKALITFTVQIADELGAENPIFTNTAQITGTGSLVEASVSAMARTRFEAYLPSINTNYPPTPILDPIPAPVNRSYTVSWEGVDTPFEYYVLQQSRYANFSSIDNSWTTGFDSRLIENAYCAYHYRVRMDNSAVWGVGPWSNVERGQASPPSITLNNIPTPDGNNSYTVSWTASPVPVDRYVLQEATDPDFTNLSNAWQITTTSQLVQKGASGGGTFYYRVRADDDDCWGPGPWSNTKSVMTRLSYDFNSTCSAWAVREDTGDDGPEGSDWYSSKCKDGKLEIWVNDRWEHVIVSPLVMSPDRPFEIQTSIYFQDRSWSSGYGLIFGIMEREVVRYYRINVVYLSAGSMKFQVKRCHSDHCSEGVVISIGEPGADSAGYIQVPLNQLNGQQWNDWRVQRTADDHIKVYANNYLLVDIGDGIFSGVGYFGLMVSTWEFKPASILVNYYNVVPLQ